MAKPSFRDTMCANVARLLREKRIERGLSLTVLAQKAGLSRQMVSYVESEARNPTLDTLLRLTGALDVELESVIAEARAASPAEAK